MDEGERSHEGGVRQEGALETEGRRLRGSRRTEPGDGVRGGVCCTGCAARTRVGMHQHARVHATPHGVPAGSCGA